LPKSRSVLDLDFAATEREILRFIRRTVKDAGARGVVVGLSGGIDSAVVGALCVKALGKDRVVALLMPSDFTPSADLEDSTALAERWGVRTFRANISRIA
jgi:NAD+ synthase